MHSFKSYQVKTKWFIQININHIDRADCPPESSEGTIICDNYPTACWKYFYPKIGWSPLSFESFSYYFSRSRRCSPTRNAFAMAVKAGFIALMLGKKLVSMGFSPLYMDAWDLPTI
jgi:hypothetical protein